MTIVIVLVATWLATKYFQKVKTTTLQEAAILGLLWLMINLVIDLMLFLPSSPMQMSPALYFSQIGVKYLCIPIITVGIGYQALKAN